MGTRLQNKTQKRTMKELLTIKQAATWASDYTHKNITPANISYLIQYGKAKKWEEEGRIKIAVSDLEDYYNNYKDAREKIFKEKLGQDLNWALSFDQYKEAETTKHVHRLHPYKGKFIPQLVEYFLDEHTDKFKKEVFFQRGDIVLDPFSGSGTTMVQASELGINAIGIDVSVFNSLLANSKIQKYDFVALQIEADRITKKLKEFIGQTHIREFEKELTEKLSEFNNIYFPSPEYKYELQQKQIKEKDYGKEKEQMFLPIYLNLVNKYGIELEQKQVVTFLDKWYFPNVKNEINCVFEEIKPIGDYSLRNIISIILSRTIRSCRATTHSDLATLLEPVTMTYYCHKHGKLCKPLFSILKWWETYSKDTIKRLQIFDKLRTISFQYCLTGDSRTIDIQNELHKVNKDFAQLLNERKIKGIFSSPPYVGLINYHEQHAYAYDLFGLERRDELEIGPLFKGQKLDAQKSYIEGVSMVLNNCKRFLVEDYNIFLVANDKYNLYPHIADKSDMVIVNQYKRPVLNRTEKDKGAYSEIIFHLRKK